MLDGPVDPVQDLVDRKMAIETVRRASIEAMLEEALLARAFEQLRKLRTPASSDHRIRPAKNDLNLRRVELSHPG